MTEDHFEISLNACRLQVRILADSLEERFLNNNHAKELKVVMQSAINELYKAGMYYEKLLERIKEEKR